MNDQRTTRVAYEPNHSNAQPGFLSLAAKTVVCHTITYFIMGVLAYHFLHYADYINNPASGMRPVSDPLVILGAPLQVFRGILFALVFYPLRDKLFGKRLGWLLMAWILIAVGILGTFAPPVGSLEGYIYTTIPVLLQMRFGYPEIVPQALLFSALLCYWVNHPARKWLNWLLSIAYCIVVALCLMALMMTRR